MNASAWSVPRSGKGIKMMRALRWIGIGLLASVIGRFVLAPVIVENRAEAGKVANERSSWSDGFDFTPKFVALVECSALMLGAAKHAEEAAIREPERVAGWSTWQSRANRTGDALINLALAEAATNNITRDSLVKIVPTLAQKTLDRFQSNGRTAELEEFERLMKSERSIDCLKRSGLVSK
jgi:hypothetical protein